MTLSHTILFSMCISFSLQAMDNQQQLHQYALIDDTCKKAWHTLDKYDPNDLHTIDDVSVIISKIKHLKYQGIDATKIGKFAYKQPILKPTLKNPSYDKSKSQWSINCPYNGYRYVSLLIALIEEHNTWVDNNKCAQEQFKRFNDLMSAITNMRNLNPEYINTLAQALYGPVKL